MDLAVRRVPSVSLSQAPPPQGGAFLRLVLVARRAILVPFSSRVEVVKTT